MQAEDSKQGAEHKGLCKPCETEETSHAREKGHSLWVVSMKTAGQLGCMGHGTGEKEANGFQHRSA